MVLQHVFLAHQRVVFGEQLISVDVWPPRSPYLSADICLRGATKASVYKDNPHSIRCLEDVISNSIKNIPHDEVLRVFNKIKQVDPCLQALGDISK
jgi:hypothetical protein